MPQTDASCSTMTRHNDNDKSKTGAKETGKLSTLFIYCVEGGCLQLIK